MRRVFPWLFDHLVGASKQRLWDGDSQRVGRFQVDDEFELGRRLHRKTAWPLTFQNTVDVLGGAAIRINLFRSIGGEAPLGDVDAAGKDGGQSISRSQINDEFSMSECSGAACHNQAAIR